jgi:hypothetical protein
VDVREAMKTEVRYECGTDIQWDSSEEWPLVHVPVSTSVKLESLDVVAKMTTRRIYNYVNTVRGDLYRCEHYMGENSPEAKQIYKWVMDVYDILNKRKHKIPR